MVNRGMISPKTGRFVDRITGRTLNNRKRRKYQKRADRYAEYEANRSLDAGDARRAAAIERRTAIQANNQKILDGVDASNERRKNGVKIPPRHIRRRPLQKAWKERNTK